MRRLSTKTPDQVGPVAGLAFTGERTAPVRCMGGAGDQTGRREGSYETVSFNDLSLPCSWSNLQANGKARCIITGVQTGGYQKNFNIFLPSSSPNSPVKGYRTERGSGRRGTMARWNRSWNCPGFLRSLGREGTIRSQLRHSEKHSRIPRSVSLSLPLFVHHAF